MMKIHYIAVFYFSLTSTVLGEDNTNPSNRPMRDELGVEEVSPVEDLMREHGVLNRLLLIYEEIIKRLNDETSFSASFLKRSATIVQDFIENYHEKLEEDYIFSRFEKEGKMVGLVEVLKKQHQQGREITKFLLEHVNDKNFNNSDQRKKTQTTLQTFITMYRPHEAREDTILFPAFKTLITQKEYLKLGEIFEEKENQLFGEEGFTKVVNEVTQLEKELGIYNLSQFNPKN